jgi:hypothetical protein
MHTYIYILYQGIETEFRDEEDRMNRLRAEGAKSKGNKQSVPYDPLTLEYQKSLEGLKLRNEDDFVCTQYSFLQCQTKLNTNIKYIYLLHIFIYICTGTLS